MYSYALVKVRKNAKIRNPYNQIPHLTQDTIWESDKYTRKHHIQETSICEQFSFTQTIKTPTHFTEHSSSLIDIILTNNENHLLYSGVGDPFLNQEVRYHCHVFGTSLAFSTLLNLNANHISVIPGHTTKVIITFSEKKLQRPIGKVYTIKT